LYVFVALAVDQNSGVAFGGYATCIASQANKGWVSVAYRSMVAELNDATNEG